MYHSNNYADDKIKHALLKLLEEKSIDEINVSLLCNKAEVQRQTFYYYFKDIYGAIRVVVGEEYIRYIKPYRPSGEWQIVLLHSLYFVKENKSIINNLYFSQARERIKQDGEVFLTGYFRPRIEEIAIKNGIYLKRRSIEYLIGIYRASILEVIYGYIENQMEESLDAVVKRTGAILQGTILKAMRTLEKIDKEFND